jgi:AcrR family transcriptional regulator
MSHTSPTPAAVATTRRAQKLRTRRTLLDAALGLLEHQSLSSLGLREVTRAAGVAPAAFYRHFADTAELGVALVEEALDGLHPMVGAILTDTATGSGTASASASEESRIARSVALIARHVRDHPAHVRFVTREQHGGVRPVRAAIGTQLQRFTEEVAAGLAGRPEAEGWSAEDLRMLAGIYVDHLVMTASGFLDAAEEGATRTEEQVAALARRQLRLVALGRRHWLDRDR